LKCYLINLDRSPERLERMTAILGGLGIEFERVAAVDGRTLTEEQAIRTPPADGMPGLTPNEIGCLLSHRRCLERIVAGDEPYAAIFEDDIHLTDDARHLLTRSDWIPTDAEIIRIETLPEYRIYVERQGVKVGTRHVAVRMHSLGVGAAGYIVSRSAAARLLHFSKTVSVPFDLIVFDPRFGFFQKLVAYQLIPALCVQDNAFQRSGPAFLASMIEPERATHRRADSFEVPLEPAHHFSWPRKIWREIRRPFEQWNKPRMRWVHVPFE
jgi:glycosyl transferase family 25